MPKAYLTIDDSPSPYSETILDFLQQNGLQALFFCRGDFLQHSPDPMIKALKQGHLLGNHLYSHTPAGDLGISKTLEEIDQTEAILEDIHDLAGIRKPGKFIRFPYLDRGDKKCVEREFDQIFKDQQTPHIQINTKSVTILQKELKERGYFQPFACVNHPYYALPEVHAARDSLLTFTSYDWMLSDKHRNQQRYQTLEDLKKRIDEDPWLRVDGMCHIVLFHDYKEYIQKETCALIQHMLDLGITFKEFEACPNPTAPLYRS